MISGGAKMPITESVLCSQCGRRTRYQEGAVPDPPLCCGCERAEEDEYRLDGKAKLLVRRKQSGAKARDERGGGTGMRNIRRR